MAERERVQATRDDGFTRWGVIGGVVACAVAVAAGWNPASAQSLAVYERVRLNVASTSNNLNPQYIGSFPAAVAWNGSTIYLAGMNATGTTGTTAITRVADPLAAPGLGVVPAFSAGFGLRPGTGNGRGYTGIAVAGGTLAAAWDNGTTTPATTDGLQAFRGADGTLLWTGTLNGRQMGGVAFDPGYVVGGASQGGAGVSGLVLSSGRRPLLDLATGTTIYGLTGSAVPGMVINTSPANAEWRDVDFDSATGDIYSRNSNNVAYGIRTGVNAVSGNAQQFLVNNANSGTATAGQNLAFMPGVVDAAGSFSGNAVVWNNRPFGTTNGSTPFTSANRIVATTGAAVTVDWNLLFDTTPANGNGWYDFGYDAGTKTLAVMDFQNRTVSIFDLDVAVQTVAAGTAAAGGPLPGNVPLAKRGAGTLVIDQPAAFAAGSVYVEEGTLQIGSGGTTGVVGSPVAVTVSSGATLAFDRSDDYGGPFTDRIGGGGGVLLRGGTLTLTASNAYTGGTTIAGGKLRITAGEQAGTGTIVPLAGGTLTFAPAIAAAVAGLDPNAGGLVDVATSSVTVTGGLSAAAMLTAILAGRGDGSWTGASGITSTDVAMSVAASVPRAIGWLDDGSGAVTFAYAAPGDTNIDGQVDILDAANFAASGKYGSGEPATWLEGDFGYDGVVDILDASDFMSTGLYGAGPYVPPATAAVAAVPEPAVSAVAALVAAAAAAGWPRRPGGGRRPAGPGSDPATAAHGGKSGIRHC